MEHQNVAGNKRRIHVEGQHPCNGEGMHIGLHDKINRKQEANVNRQHPHARGGFSKVAHKES